MTRKLDLPEAESAFDVLRDLVMEIHEEAGDEAKVRGRVAECLAQVEIGLRALDAGSELDYAAAVVAEVREHCDEVTARDLAVKLAVDYDRLPPRQPQE